ncbi:hypothetical protein ES703_15245 [subsurface metagenome]
MTTEETITDMLGKPYVVEGTDQSHKHICWSFCREICALFELPLQHYQHYDKQLCRITEPVVPCIVLFHVVIDWHAGVVWPDGLHFVHASPKNILDPNPTEYVVRKDSLTAWPYKLLIEGYYHNSKLKTQN